MIDRSSRSFISKRAFPSSPLLMPSHQLAPFVRPHSHLRSSFTPVSDRHALSSRSLNLPSRLDRPISLLPRFFVGVHVRPGVVFFPDSTSRSQQQQFDLRPEAGFIALSAATTAKKQRKAGNERSEAVQAIHHLIIPHGARLVDCCFVHHIIHPSLTFCRLSFRRRWSWRRGWRRSHWVLFAWDGWTRPCLSASCHSTLCAKGSCRLRRGRGSSCLKGTCRG